MYISTTVLRNLYHLSLLSYNTCVYTVNISTYREELHGTATNTLVAIVTPYYNFTLKNNCYVL